MAIVRSLLWVCGYILICSDLSLGSSVLGKFKFGLDVLAAPVTDWTFIHQLFLEVDVLNVPWYF